MHVFFNYLHLLFFVCLRCTALSAMGNWVLVHRIAETQYS